MAKFFPPFFSFILLPYRTLIHDTTSFWTHKTQPNKTSNRNLRYGRHLSRLLLYFSEFCYCSRGVIGSLWNLAVNWFLRFSLYSWYATTEFPACLPYIQSAAFFSYCATTELAIPVHKISHASLYSFNHEDQQIRPHPLTYSFRYI